MNEHAPVRVGFAMTGSFCTFSQVIDQMEQMAQQTGWQLYPILSPNAYETDTRFGSAQQFRRRIEEICGREIWHTLTQTEPIGPKKLLDVLLVGIAQAIATCPGISRSGTTITAGCFVGFDRKFAVRFSFLLSIPAVLGANILSIGEAVREGIDVSLLPAYIVGTLVAAVSGYFAIRLVNLLADKGKFGNFAYYCWGIGAAAVVASLIFR